MSESPARNYAIEYVGGNQTDVDATVSSAIATATEPTGDPLDDAGDGDLPLVETLPTDEIDTALVLAPNGVGGVEFRPEAAALDVLDQAIAVVESAEAVNFGKGLRVEADGATALVDALEHGALSPTATITSTKDAGNPTFNGDFIPENIVWIAGIRYAVGMSWAESPKKIRLWSATSRDGPWTSLGVIYQLTDVPWSLGTANGIYAAELLLDDDGTICLYYSVANETTGADGKVGLATATVITGPYTDSGSALISPGAGGSWNSLRVGEASVLHRDGRYVLAAMGEKATFGLNEKVGIWTATSRSGPFTAAAGNPISWPAGIVLMADPHIFFENGLYWMLVSEGANGDGTGTRPWFLSLWYATDPVTGTWTRHESSPILLNGGVGTWEEKAAWRGSVWLEEGIYNVIYGGLNAALNVAKGGNARLTVTPPTAQAPTSADYLVGTAQAGLSGEIVVGTTPGGELGGTWASPTVDGTHSGSAHTDFIAKAIVDAKGDLIAATAADTVARVPAGTDGQLLKADSAATAGVSWADAATTGGAHVHVVSENHLSDGSTGTYTLDQFYEPGSVIAWNVTTLARLTVTEVDPDQATVSPVGSTGDSIVFDYAATLA